MKERLNNPKRLLGLIILIVIALIAIIIALIGIQLNKNIDSIEGENIVEQKGENLIETYGKSENGNIDKQAYFEVTNCINQYLNAINIKKDSYYAYDEDGNYNLIVSEEEIKTNIYNLLSKNYVSQNNITIQNLYSKVETLETSNLFVPLEISMLQNNVIKSFLVHGLLESQKDYSIIKEMFIIVNLDIAGRIYSVEPITGKYNKIEEVKIGKLETKLEANANNKFSVSYATNEESVKDYINIYKRLALGKPEKLYELLDKEYRAAKFGSIDNFKKYITEKKNEIIGTRVEQYKTEREGEYIQYVCIDQNGHYYIFREKGALDYTLLLDTYTVNLPEFTAKYEKASNENKVLMNIQKFFDAIEDGDYKYAYNKLDETFRNNNFKTQAAFESYVKKNFFAKNTLSAGKAEKQGNVYLYNVTITDESKKDSKTVTKSFVMQLKEGTDFVMSFGVQ